MTLTDWELNGWLTPHTTSRREIADLLSIVERDLRDCAQEGLRPDWQLAIAYNAALQAAQAALAASGYRATSADEATETSQLAKALRELVVGWLRAEHPRLLD